MKNFYLIIIPLLLLASCSSGNEAKQTDESNIQRDSLTAKIKEFSQNGVFNEFH